MTPKQLEDAGYKIVLRRWNGAHHHEYEISLSEFAALFTYGKVYPADPSVGPDNAIMVRSDVQPDASEDK